MSRGVKIGLLVSFAAAIGGMWLWYQRKPSLSDSNITEVRPVVSNGAVVLRSFQTVDVSPSAEPAVRAPSSEREKERQRPILDLKRNPKLTAKQIRAADLVEFNGQKFVLDKSFEAIREVGAKNPNGPDGFKIGKRKEPFSSQSQFREGSLLVLKDNRGFERFVVTGALVVKMKDESDPKTIASELGLDIVYLAPQIKTAIFKAKDGQDLFATEKALKSRADVSSVTIEVLGKGASSK